MIVYNVQRLWFTMKAGAEKYRVSQGLPPAATFKLEIADRDDLAGLLNALSSNEATPSTPVLPLPAPVRERTALEVPDYVPAFLAKAWAKFSNTTTQD